MSASANYTVVLPGDGWNLQWSSDTFISLQLDIVGFLALLGEGSLLANAQVSALSKLFYLPRLLPAPQALLRPSRPTTLPPIAGTVAGVHSGNVKDHIHHIASILLGGELPLFEVRCVKIKKKSERALTRVETFVRGGMRPDSQRPKTGPPLVTAKATGPMTWVTLIGFSFSVILFVASWTFGDGFSMLATVTLSLLSTFIGMGNAWTLKQARRLKDIIPPAGDVVIRYANGSFCVVRCNEDVARELYTAPEEIQYNIKSSAVYRLIFLVGTIMLMVGVVALANAKLQLQFGWAGAYILINAAHWIAAALPAKLHWDLSCYEIEEESLSTGPNNQTFTDALWKTIVLTKSCRWISNSKAAPQTLVWDEWLLEAEDKAQEVQDSIEPLQDLELKWHGENMKDGIVWVVPTDWNPRQKWDDINKLHAEATGSGSTPTSTAA